MSSDELDQKIKERFRNIIRSNRALATIAVCLMACFSMWVSKGQTGIGWGILGVFIIWME